MINLSDADLAEAVSTALRELRLDDFERLAAEADRRDAEREQRLSSPGALATAALWYATNGIAVFPIQPRDKKPFPGTRGFKDATTDPAAVRRWWAHTPNANIGVPTGIRFDVIDVDGRDGYFALADLKDADILPPILGKVQTPRGGRHLYVPKSGDGNAAGVWPGVDYRGIGGYVVAPPSIGATGRRYDWLAPLDVAALPAGDRG